MKVEIELAVTNDAGDIHKASLEHEHDVFDWDDAEKDALTQDIIQSVGDMIRELLDHPKHEGSSDLDGIPPGNPNKDWLN